MCDMCNKEGEPRCEACARMSSKVIGLELAIFRNKQHLIPEWKAIEAILEGIFINCKKVEFSAVRPLENMVDLLVIESCFTIDHETAMNMNLADAIHVLSKIKPVAADLTHNCPWLKTTNPE